MSEINFDCETRDENTSFKHHVIAGSLAGIQEHILILPFDNIKTHSQVMDQGVESRYSNIVRTIYNRGGFKEFYRGSQFVALGCGPAHAAYFSIYEFSKVSLGIQNEELNPFLFFMVGCSATIFHDFIMTPCDVLKQRSQLTGNPKASKMIKDIISREGIKSLYRSYPITLMMNLPWQGTLVATNETLKRLYTQDKDHTFATYFMCAGIAAAVASTLTIPFDNVRTRLQTQCCYLNESWYVQAYSKSQQQQTAAQQQGVENVLKQNGVESNFQKIKNFFFLNYNQKYAQSYQKNLNSNCAINFDPMGCDKYQIKYKNLSQAFQTIYLEEGLRGFTKGIGPRVASATPASAVQWATYETIKRFLVEAPNKSV